ncbi:MAG: family 20 glycosylhydrolase [Candidatus Krumholzibacteriia bacterium]
MARLFPTFPAALLLAAALPAKGPAMPATAPLPLIPAPLGWEADGGTLAAADLGRIVVVGGGGGGSGAAAAQRQAALLAGWWHQATGRTPPVQSAGPGPAPAGAVVLALTGSGPDTAPTVPGEVDERCTLLVRPDGITVTAAAPAGLFRGAQAVRQLLLAAAAGDGRLPTGRAELAPRCRWRGMMLDSGRHLQDVPTILGLIDQLALYGFNVLHWHLTEDQGWRLEVPGHPALTEVGAWRTGPDGRRYGGFYTADQVREVVAHAAARFVTVVPEIELPGHAKAALASYPELSCTGGPFAVETQWGIHADVFCAGNDAVFALLGDVFDQVVALFPGAYVHIGGDEVPKDRWRACPRCQARLRDEGLADAHALQSWFVRRASRLLQDRGRRLIGWDEILEGGLPPGATVQSWRGTAGAVAAAEAGHDAVVSPTSHAYFDYDPGQLPLQKVLAFDPVPPGLGPEAAARILGGALNLWTEYVPPGRIGRQLFPRLPAMAEALGAPAGPKPLDEFLPRLTVHESWWPKVGITPGVAARPLRLRTDCGADGGCTVQAVPADPDGAGFAGLERHVRIAAFPRSDRWQADLPPEEQLLPTEPAWSDGDRWTGAPDEPMVVFAQLLLAAPGAAPRPYGAPAVVELEPSVAAGRPVAFAVPPSGRYPGRGPHPLTDGVRGGRDFRDGRWVGFEAADLDAVIDLGETRPLAGISLRAVQDAHAWVFLPRQVRFFVSADGRAWREIGSAGHGVPDREQRKLVREFAVAATGTARYVRVVAASLGACPGWHPGQGQPCWLFVDEIRVF